MNFLYSELSYLKNDVKCKLLRLEYSRELLTRTLATSGSPGLAAKRMFAGFRSLKKGQEDKY